MSPPAPDPSVASPASAQAQAARVIKKYPNRRLYDTDTSTYITLAEIKRLVMQSAPLVVRDAKTGEDLTRSILLQIILEEEAAGVPVFTEPMLANIIRFYGHAMQGYMGNYLEHQLQLFMDWQSRMGEQSQKSLTPEVWSQFMQWQSPLMQNMFAGFMNPQQHVLGQMHEHMQQQMQKTTEQMLGVLGLKT